MNYRLIFRMIGRILQIVAVFMIPALAIALFQKEDAAAFGIGIAIAASAAIGTGCALLKPRSKRFFAREGFVTVGLAWIAVSLFGALPLAFRFL